MSDYNLAIGLRISDLILIFEHEKFYPIINKFFYNIQGEACLTDIGKRLTSKIEEIMNNG